MRQLRRILTSSKRADFRRLIAATIFYAVAACTVPNDDPLTVIPPQTEPDPPGQTQNIRDAGAPNALSMGGTSGQTLLPDPDDGSLEFDAATVPLGSGGSTPIPPMGGMGGTNTPPLMGGTAGTTPPPPVRATSYDFEINEQNWIDLKAQGSVIARTTSKAATGTASLSVTIDTQTNAANGTERYIGVPRTITPALQAGKTVKYGIWIPSGNKLIGVQPFVVTQGTSRAGVGRWQGKFMNTADLAKDAWNNIEVPLPADYEVNDLEWFGVQFITQAGGWKGTVFIDAVFF